MDTRPIIILDMDHTLANSYGRDQMLVGPPDWYAYHTAGAADNVNEDMACLVDALNCTDLYNLVVVTCRPEKYRALTMQWLMQHGIEVDELIMRPDGDTTPSKDLKLILMARHYGQDWAKMVMLAIDDNESVISSYRAMKISTLQYSAAR